MSITDELREWFENAYTYGPFIGGEFPKKYAAPWFGWKPTIVEMLDRIDAEHEAKVSYWQGASYKDGYDEGFASADDWLGQHEDAMAEHGWVKLPVDADGVPFRIGDKVDGYHYEDGTVTGIQFYEMANGGIRTLIAVRPDGWDVATWHTPDEYRHHHEPTVEDVLRDYASRILIAGCIDEEDELVAEYAAKLRLAGDGE